MLIIIEPVDICGEWDQFVSRTNINGRDMEKSCLIIQWRKQQSLAVEHYDLKGILIFMERAALSRQASMVSVIMDCRKEKMHHSFCVKNLYRVILMGLPESMPHRKAIL